MRLSAICSEDRNVHFRQEYNPSSPGLSLVRQSLNWQGHVAYKQLRRQRVSDSELRFTAQCLTLTLT